MAEAGSSGLFISGGIPASPSVDSVVKSFSPDERIRSWLIVQRLLSAHPEYGDERGAELSKRPGPAAGYLTSASQWLDDVRSLVNPDNTKKLHGRLVILGLCRLDLALAAYLDDHDLTNALKKELAEPWQSVITGKPSPDVNCREAFLDLLWNAGKFESTASPPRDRGFIGLVSDPSSACHLQDLCFRQDRNTCLTAGYRFNAKEGLSGLLAYFFSDLSAILRGRGDVRGRFAPDPVGDEWQGWLKNPMGQFLKDRHAVATTSLVSFPLDSIIHQLAREDVLGTGERLVLFAELVDVPRNVTFADLGFPEDVLTILERQPERFGIVLAGLPESITIPSRGPYFRTLPPPVPDPAAHGQHFTNDEPVGPDRLNIKTEVDALAETIALKEMKPPLVVGILV